jgi:hypothetical protein
MRPAAFIAILASFPLSAQSLRVYSELAQIDSSGEVTSPRMPREILSPALARNAFTSFQIVVQVKPGTPYWLHVGENPEDAVKVTLYRRNGDRLEPVSSPYHGDTTQVIRLDLWVDRNAAVRRIKVEPQLDVNDDWVQYPMEARVMDATVPDGPWPEGAATPAAAMKAFLCGSPLLTTVGESEFRLRFRNAQQDVALAARAPKTDLLRLIGGCAATPPDDPEWYLRIRDYLYRMR